MIGYMGMITRTARNIEVLDQCEKHMDVIPVDMILYTLVDYEEELKL